MRVHLERIAREEQRERDTFRAHLAEKEGDRDDIYLDTNGYPTVGIGHRLPDSYRSRVGERISAEQKEAFFRADADKALRAARRQMREAGITDPTFLTPLASVNFQLGSGWHTEHRNTWARIRRRQYAEAAREARNSAWYRQTPERVRLFSEALIRLELAEQARRKRRTGSTESRRRSR